MRVVTDIPVDDEHGGDAVVVLLNALAVIWSYRLRKFPLPPLYSSGIRYQTEPNAGQWEDFKSPVQTFESGWGDCDDLVLYRVSELRAAGEPATVQCLVKRDAVGTRMHVRVRRANGKEEDPCLLVEKRVA